MRIFIVFSLFALLTACAGEAVRPQWVTTVPAEFSAVRYLSGRGQAETSGLARDRARADLAKIFEVAVRESSSEALQWQQGVGQGDGLKTRISRDITSRTSQVVEGIEIVETWRAETGGDYHALAVLNRLQASNRLRAEIDELDNQTRENIERAGAENNLPEQVAAAYNALDAQVRRIHQQKMLRVVDVTGRGLPPEYPLVTLKNNFEELLDRWTIGVRVERDQIGGLTELLAGALAGSGFRHLDDASQAAYLLQAVIDNEQLTGGDGWFWVRGTLRISLIEATSGNRIGSHHWSYKASARQADMAEIRARDQLSEVLSRELLKALVGFGDPTP
jgi:hypothetical protein